MLDFARCNAGELDVVQRVIETLTSPLHEGRGLDPMSIMVVGAECRNILHTAQAHTFTLRSTTDVDLAIALSDWETFDRLVDRLPPIGHTGIRYLAGAIPIDLLPFGGVENPTGTVTPARRNSPLSVFAFQEVFNRAVALPLSQGLSVRVPSPAGYAALKMYAWVERSVDLDDRDAPDLATVAYCYQESADITDRLYDTDEGQTILQATAWDLTLGSAWLLGQDIAAETGPARTSELKNVWSRTDLNYLATRFGSNELPHWPTEQKRRRAIIDALGTAILA